MMQTHFFHVTTETNSGVIVASSDALESYGEAARLADESNHAARAVGYSPDSDVVMVQWTDNGPTFYMLGDHGVSNLDWRNLQVIETDRVLTVTEPDGVARLAQ